MPRPTPGRKRPPLSTSRVAISLARITGLRPGITSTEVPSFIRSVRPTAMASTTSGSGAGAPMRSETQSESNPSSSQRSTTAAKRSAVPAAVIVPRPMPILTFRGDSVRRSSRRRARLSPTRRRVQSTDVPSPSSRPADHVLRSAGAVALLLVVLAACSSSSGTAAPGSTDPQPRPSPASAGPREGGTSTSPSPLPSARGRPPARRGPRPNSRPPEESTTASSPVMSTTYPSPSWPAGHAQRRLHRVDHRRALGGGLPRRHAARRHLGGGEPPGPAHGARCGGALVPVVSCRPPTPPPSWSRWPRRGRPSRRCSPPRSATSPLPRC